MTEDERAALRALAKRHHDARTARDCSTSDALRDELHAWGAIGPTFIHWHPALESRNTTPRECRRG